MRLSMTAAALFLACFTNSLNAQFGGFGPGYSSGGDVGENHLSVFNDTVRRFRFDLEGTLVTAETAEMFMVRYRDQGDKKIIGAYADAETNTLVVVGSPDAETSIRQTLAESIVNSQGEGPPSLTMQHRTLEHRRRMLLRMLASIEIETVTADAEKAAALKERIASFRKDVDVVQKQLKIVQRYMEELGSIEQSAAGDPFGNESF